MLCFPHQLAACVYAYLGVLCLSCTCSVRVWRPSPAQQDCRHPSVSPMVKSISSSFRVPGIFPLEEPWCCFVLQPAAPKGSVSISRIFMATSSSFQVELSAPPDCGRVKKAMHSSTRDRLRGPHPIFSAWVVAPSACSALIFLPRWGAAYGAVHVFNL